MYTLILWWAGILVESVILVRGVRLRTLVRFPFFFLYIGSVFCADVSLYFVHAFASYPSYLIWAARAETVNIVVGYGIILEIFRHVFSLYRGIERLSQIVGLAVFVIVLCTAMFYRAASPGLGDALSRKAMAERDLLAAQAIFFLTAIAIIRYYGLETGRNIRGIIVGYGIWLGASIITLELRTYLGPAFTATWVFFQPFFYLFSLMQWLFAMWNYSPILAPDPVLPITQDYEALAATTGGVATRVRAYLGRMAR